MKEWKFGNVEVYEKDYDGNLHCFKCYADNKYIGTVYPESVDEMEKRIDELDNGIDPISGKWSDGCGNICDINGFGDIAD